SQTVLGSMVATIHRSRAHGRGRRSARATLAACGHDPNFDARHRARRIAVLGHARGDLPRYLHRCARDAPTHTQATRKGATMRTLRRCACVPITAGVLVLPIWFAPEPALAQPPEPEPAFVLFIVDELMHDDNLFRVPHESVNNPSLRPIEHVEDYANQLTVGARARLQSGRQTLRVAARVSDVQFHRNDQLDYTGGQANLALDWELGSRLSGRVLGDYRRSLASYTNYRFFERDIVEAIDGALETRIGIGPRFALLSSVRARQTDHSDPERRSENFESDAASVGLEYAPSQTKRFALEY